MSAMTFGKIGTKPLFKHWTARDYVQNGLVAMWDGIENAGWGTHDSNATVWKDLVGTDDLSIGSDITKAKFEATALWRNLSLGNLVSGNLSFPLTIEMLIDVDASFSGTDTNPRLFAFNTGSPRREIDCYTANPSRAPRLYDPTKYAEFNRSSIGLWSISCYFADTTSVVLRENICGKTYSTSLSAVDPPVRLNIGAWQSTYSAMKGLYHVVRVYSRALTADEIAYNYNIDKVRFNLP